MSAAPATHFGVSAPATTTAGSSLPVIVTALDSYNNTAASYGGRVHFTSSDAQATLSADNTLSNGSGAFSVVLKTAGSQTVTATDTVTNSITGTSNQIAVQPAALDHLLLSPANATITAGGSQAYSAEGLDQYGNDLGNVTTHTTFTIAPDGSCTNASCGASTAAGHTVTGTDSGKTGQTTLNVIPAALDHILLSPGAASTMAGAAQPFTVTGYDQYGNSRGDVTALATFSISPSGAGTGASCSGASCTATTVGTYSVTAVDAGKGAQASLTVTAAPLDHLSLAPATATILTRSSQTYSATGFDQYGNSRGDVTTQTTFTINPNGAGTGATCTGNSCGAIKPGSYTITGTDTGKTGQASLTVKARNGDIVFARAGGGGGDQSNIFVMHADGSNLHALTSGSVNDITPTWSPDGTRIAFTRNGHIYVMNANGGGVAALTSGQFVDSTPEWSPEGAKIAFTSSRGGRTHIYAMNADGSAVLALTSGSVYDLMPSWSPDGSKIAFTSSRAGNAHIYVMNANGSGITALTSGSSVDASPDWSPDGAMIAFSQSQGGQTHIYLMNASGSGVAALTSGSGVDVLPEWSPDGSRIGFSSTRGGTLHIYLINVDGTGLAPLTTGVTLDTSPSWRAG